MLSWFDSVLGYKDYFIAIGGTLGFISGGIILWINYSKHRLDKAILKLYLSHSTAGVIRDYNTGKTRLTGDCLILRVKNIGRQPFYIESVGIFTHDEICHTLKEYMGSFSLSHSDQPREYSFPIESIITAYRNLSSDPESNKIMVRGCINHFKENQHLSKKRLSIINK